MIKQNVDFVVDNGKYTTWHNGRVETYEVQPAFKGILYYYLSRCERFRVDNR